LGLFGWLFGKRKAHDTGNIRGGDDDDVQGAKPELLIVGLGNPGREYARTRHNIGFGVIDELCASGCVDVEAPKVYCRAECRLAVCGAGRKPVLLVKPLTYMNLSGDAVSALMDKYGLTAADVIVILDDFNIPLGNIRLRRDGSSGGHNGLNSINAAIGPQYPRVRLGIGPRPARVSITDFVLGRFSDEEIEGKVIEVIKTAAEAIVFMVDNGVDAAMNRYN
jgi:PTH1 family peptidyl-tRNA hydrolase